MLSIKIRVENEVVEDHSQWLMKTIKYLPPWNYTLQINRGRTRTLEQNNRYRAILWAIAEYTGEDIDTLHDIFKGMFLKKKAQSEIFGWIEAVGSTKKLPTKEFGEYMEKVELRCAENWILTWQQ
jgi:hypothetical protein